MTVATSTVPLHDSRVGDFIALLKPRVTSLVVFTAGIGLYLAPGTLHPFLNMMVICAIALGAGAAGALNMWYDADIDAKMLRTRGRPIPQGRIARDDALFFGLILSIASVVLLDLASNWKAAALLAFSIFFYVVIYTIWLKRRTPQNIVIGGAAGAFPPLIAWVAVTDIMHPLPWIMVLIIFLWTPPHFWALALYRAQDYEQAGVPMYPVRYGRRATERQILLYTWLLVSATYLPLFSNELTWIYGALITPLNTYFLYLAHRLPYDSTFATARRLFLVSILYLFSIFLAMVLGT